MQGDYTGSCVACLQGTDTGLGFEGSAEWAAAGLVCLGLPLEVAVEVLSLGTDSKSGTVPAGMTEWTFRVCGGCASRANLEVGLLAKGAPFPVYRET